MIDYLKSLQILTEEEIKELYGLSEKRVLDEGDFFIRENSICKEVAFIQNGLLRSFYTNQEGKEITYCITFQNRFMTAYSSLISGRPTPENIQALMNTELLVIQVSELNKLAEQGSNWIELQKYFAEQEYIELEQRVFAFQKKDARQRYMDLLEDHPEYLRKIPLKYVASYLGITVRHLSRIRREIMF